MKRFHKKGIQLAWQKLIVHTLELLVIVFIFVPLGVIVLDILVERPKINSINNLERLGLEIQGMIREARTGDMPAARTIPVFVAEDFPIGLSEKCTPKNMLKRMKKENVSCIFLYKGADSSQMSNKIEIGNVLFQSDGHTLSSISRDEDGISNVKVSISIPSAEKRYKDKDYIVGITYR